MLRFFTFLLSLYTVSESVAQTKIANTSFAQEICGNGFDDDEDGYVDCYDPDCGCFATPNCVGMPPNKIQGRLAWRTTSKDLSWVAVPIVANLNPQTDNIPEIILIGGSGSLSSNTLYIYKGDGSNPNQPDKVHVAEGIPAILPLHPAVGDLDGDGRPEVVVGTKNGLIQIFRNYTPGAPSAMELWLTSDLPVKGTISEARQKRLHLADFNGDGIAEIYAGGSIFQLDLSAPASLKKVLDATGPEGIFLGGSLTSDKYAAPTAADMLTITDCNGDPDCDGLELVAGGTIYAVDLDVTDGDGREIKAVRQLNTAAWGDGYTSVADVNLDGIPDAVVSSFHKYTGLTDRGLYVYDKNGLIRFLPHPERFVPNGGGLVGIANLYDDRKHGFAKDYPEMIAVGLHRLTCFNLNAATINPDSPWWWSIEVDDESASTGCSLFDLNSDGLMEIVYHDQSNLRILYGGAAPFPPNVDAERNWWKIITGSGTRDEYPVVVDANGDGQAEIVTVGLDNPVGPQFPSGNGGDLRVYKSAAMPWSACRPVWNQYNFNAIGINNDLSIPAHQQKHWLEFPSTGSGNYPFNTQLAQQALLNKQFQPFNPLPDADIALDSFVYGPLSLNLFLRVCNLGTTTLSANMPLRFYLSDPTKSAAISFGAFYFLPKDIPADSCLRWKIQLAIPPSNTLWGVINDNGVLPAPFNLANQFPVTGIHECDYANNLDSFEVKLPELKKLDLGPDRSICQGEITNLDAGSGYVQYNWKTGAGTQTIGVATTGNYAIEVIDAYGRKQYDTVRVTVFPNPKRSIKVVLLPGDSIILAGNTYFSAATVMDTLPALTGVCDTVVTYTILLDSLTCKKAASFLKTYDASTGRVLLSAKDGSIYLAGENLTGTLLSKSDANGNLLWTRQIFDIKQAVVRISSLIEDSEGILVGCGNAQTGRRSFAFRYDPATDQILWFKQIDLDRPIFAAGVIEKESGGDYLLYHYLLSNGSTNAASEIWPLDRSTGELIGGKAFHYDPWAIWYAAKMHQGSLYAIGYIRDTVMAGAVLNGITKINPNTGTVLWAQQTENALITGRDIIIDADGNIVTLSNKNGLSEIWLQKTAPDGALLWLRKYQPAVAPAPFSGMSLKLLPDGHYVISGVLQSSAQSNTLVLAKIDKNGGVIWAKRIPQLDLIGTPSPQLLAVQGNDIYFTYGASATATVNSTLFGKMDSAGNLGENCGAVQDLTIAFIPENRLQQSVTLAFSTVPQETTSPVINPPIPVKLLPYSLCSACSTCDSVEVTKITSFYPGDTILIDGTAYTQSDTVVQNLTTTAGCDSVVTNILQLIITNVSITCPANFTVTLPPNSTSTLVDYNGPIATTDCPDPTITLKLLQGPPIGGSFTLGATQVCYEAANQCGIRDTCCFTITAQQPDPSCDIKTPPGCIRYELLNIRVDSIGQRRYRVRLTNTCASPLEFAYIQLPNGVSAVSPKEGAIYTAPGGNTYAVRNPNASPFYSVRYKAGTGSLNNGKSDIFEYRLPQQSQPAYIHVAAKLADGSTSEAHLNTYYCPVLMENNLKEQEALKMEREMPSTHHASLLVRPNPTNGLLLLQLGQWQGQQVQVQVLNAQGQMVLERGYAVENEEVGLDLPTGLASGLYYLVVQLADGQRMAVRFVLER